MSRGKQKQRSSNTNLMLLSCASSNEHYNTNGNHRQDGSNDERSNVSLLNNRDNRVVPLAVGTAVTEVTLGKDELVGGNCEDCGSSTHRRAYILPALLDAGDGKVVV
ncbi:hypothetical protein C8F04DRAFT_1193442 [Mycena alexandri]|uniref:Uncharacterized protein n=1 Tax=Mycena alexandri TaxID=1745969 RepID=A0AAD6SDG4_9AGAR|nr:hypothetical protein C8F04DRAFT_1193442 [Mycena alexandri]